MRVQRLPDGTVLVSAKDRGERRAERVTLALLIVWLGVMLSVTEPHGLTPLGFGAILLGSAVYQRVRGWHAGLVTWIVGGILIGVGIGDLSSHAKIPWFGIAVVLVGLWLLARAARRAF